MDKTLLTSPDTLAPSRLVPQRSTSKDVVTDQFKGDKHLQRAEVQVKPFKTYNETGTGAKAGDSAPAITPGFKR